MRERMAAWLRLTPWGFPAGDVALAAFVLLVALASVLTGNPDEGPLSITVPVAVASAAALLWRRRSPILAVLVAMTAGISQALLSVAPGSMWSLAVDAIVMYSVATTYTEGLAAAVGALFAAGTLVQERLDNGVDYAFIILLFGGIWLLGRASRLWRNRLSRSEQQRQDAARIAVAEERVRIARELHDIVAHSLSVIAIHADAGDAALDSRPDQARESLRTIRTTARGSLAEIRQLLQVLRTDDEGEAPVHRSADLEQLVGTVRAAGLPVRLELNRDFPPLAPTVQATVYRIVQEALTNVLRHAGPVPTVVGVRVESGQLLVEVVNGPGQQRQDAQGEGLGLLGIRERVLAVGGVLEFGRTPDGYRVAARLPLQAQPIEAEETKQ